MSVPRSKDVVTQYYRRALRRAELRREAFINRHAAATFDHKDPLDAVFSPVMSWFEAWIIELRRQRDTYMQERELYCSRKRHERERARRGNKHRRRQ